MGSLVELILFRVFVVLVVLVVLVPTLCVGMIFGRSAVIRLINKKTATKT